jgi:regulator of sigma E protease
MKVYEFALGFPPRAFGFFKDPATQKWTFVRGKGTTHLKETIAGDDQPEEFPATIYSFHWLPLGGFVRIKGENGTFAQEQDSFAAKPAWKKVIVLSAGVIMNIFFAGVLFSIGFMIGLPADVSVAQDPDAIVIEEPRVTIQQVLPDSPADQAGLQFGDQVLSVNNAEVHNSAELIQTIASYGETPVTVSYMRGETLADTMITPTVLKEGQDAKIGIMLADATVIRYPWYHAIYKGFIAAGTTTLAIFFAFVDLFVGLVTGAGASVDVSGPVGIASIVGQSVRLGIADLINVAAMISLSLAVINIMPIPALDGGRILFVLLRKIIRSDRMERIEHYAHTGGFLLLMGLIILITVRDVIQLF